MNGYDLDYHRPRFPTRDADHTSRPPGVARYPGDPDQRRGRARTPRVTARYNLDYVIPTWEDEYDRDFVPYSRGPEGPIVEPDAYVRRYLTRGGTETYRGSDRPFGWEHGRGGSRPEGHGSARPWVGGYRRGYQGGSGGIETGEGGGERKRSYDRGYRGRGLGYDRQYRRR